jgi:HAE1 family hydrophobic/amphiphilic exporter-1
VRRFFDAFNRLLETTTNGYVSLSHAIIRKPLLGGAILLLFAASAGFLGQQLPGSFLPEEDYGYALLNVQLPPAASLDRTDAAARKIDAVLKDTPGIQNFNTIVGFSLITRVNASNTAFYFIGLKPWDERGTPQTRARAIVDSINRRLRTAVPEATAFAIMPPSIPGLGNQGGFSLWLQERRIDRCPHRTSAALPCRGP